MTVNRTAVGKKLPESEIYRKGGSLTYIACGVRRSVAFVVLPAGSHGDAAGAADDDGRVAEGMD